VANDDIDLRRLDDELSVLGWRAERLVALGYEFDEAAVLASSAADIHELERLVGRGCPLATAARIAA
jgi:hypothetical protein